MPNPNNDVKIEAKINGEVKDSNIGNVTIYYEISKIKEIFNEILGEIQEEINDIDNMEIEIKMSDSLNEIKTIFDNNIALLDNILYQVNCANLNQSKSHHNIKLKEIFFFLILIKYTDSNFNFNNLNTNGFTINKIKNWLLSPSKTGTMLSFQKYIPSIYKFLSQSKSKQIYEGNCFITKLFNNGGLSCEDCNNGKLINLEDINVMPDWLDDNNKKYLINIKQDKNIELKCGNCVSNIYEFENAKKTLGA